MKAITLVSALCFLPGCLFFLAPMGAPKGYVMGHSQAEVYEKIAKAALEKCEVGDTVYLDIGTGTNGDGTGFVKGYYWCTKEERK